MVNHRPPQSGPAIRLYMRWIALLGILILVGSCVILIVKPGWAFKAQIGGGLGVVLILLAILFRPNTVHKALIGRSVKYGSNAVVMSLAFVGILILINFLAIKSSREYDLTETKMFTLSEQTISFLENLSEPIQVIAFFRIDDYRRSLAKDYFERYRQYTDQLTYAFYDPETTLAETYEFSSYGLMFVSGTHRYEVPVVDEQNITTGLICVIDGDHQCQEKKHISIPAKTPPDHQLFLTPVQAGFTLIVSVIIIPLTVLLIGIRVWWVHQ